MRRKNYSEKSAYSITETDALSVSVQSPTSTGITLEITNHSEYELNYGSRFAVEKQVDGEWYELEPIELPEGQVFFWVDLGYALAGGETATLSLNWDGLYGSLAKGEYRVVKYDFEYRLPAGESAENSEVCIACEFMIE